MEELQRALSTTIEAIDSMSELFYTQKDTEGYAKLEETIGYISKTMELLLGSVGEIEVPKDYIEIINHLNDALSAVESKDTILLADILQYEIKERFQAILNSVN